MINLKDFQKVDVEKLSQQANVLLISPTTIANFLSHVEPASLWDCWIWTGALGGEKNYGTFAWRVGSKKFQCPAHRFAYQAVYGVIDKKLHVDHRCFNKLCVNPLHLEAVTAQENKRRSMALLTECWKGHPFDEENTYINPRGQRECKECRREATRRNYHKGRTVMPNAH